MGFKNPEVYIKKLILGFVKSKKLILTHTLFDTEP